MYYFHVAFVCTSSDTQKRLSLIQILNKNCYARVTHSKIISLLNRAIPTGSVPGVTLNLKEERECGQRIYNKNLLVSAVRGSGGKINNSESEKIAVNESFITVIVLVHCSHNFF